MADFIRVSAIKDTLTECPICTEHFDDTTRIPRRMPCCVQSICEPCLEIYSRGRRTLSCPMCRHKHHLPDGIKSLPKEPLILKILDHLKIQKGLRLPCTDCPDKAEAIARCDDCCGFLCEECHRAHARVRYFRDHKTVTFEEMKNRPITSYRRLHLCMEHQQPQQFYCYTCDKVICVSCTVVKHNITKNHNVVSVDDAHQEKAKFVDDILTKLDRKAEKLTKSIDDLKQKNKNIQTSVQKATDDVNQTFDNLLEVLQTRRAILLSDIVNKSTKDLKLTEQSLESTTTLLSKVKSSTEYTREMRGRADKIEDLQLILASTDSLTAILKEAQQDVKFDRTGVSFTPHNVTHLNTIVKSAGAVRKVTFTQTKRPDFVPKDQLYNKITTMSDVFTSGSHLEWDTNTASDNITISGSVITNKIPDPPLRDTGCRVALPGRALVSVL